MTTEPVDMTIDPTAQAYFAKRVEQMTFGKALRAQRSAEELTQEECAKALGITKQLLSEYERGVKVPSVRKAYEIGKGLGMLPEMAVLLAVNDQLKRDNIPVKLANAS